MKNFRYSILLYACVLPLVFCSTIATAQTKQLDSLHKLAKTAAGLRQVELYAQLSLLSKNLGGDTALYFATRANDLGEAWGTDASKMVGYIALARTLSTRASYHLSLKYYSQALALAEKHKNDSLAATCYNGMGNAQWQLGQHAQALDNHFRSLRIRERLNDINGITISKINIGMVYQTQDKLPIAEKYVGEALTALRKKTDDPTVLISALHTQANIYGMQGKIAEALEVDKEGISVAEATKNDFAKSVFYDNMGNCFLYSTPPDYKKAYDFFQKTLAIDSSFNNKKQMSDSYLNIANVWSAQQQFDAAAAAYRRSIVLAEECGYTQGKLNALSGLSQAFEKNGQHREAYEALQQSLQVKDSMFNTASENKIVELQTVYETEKKQQQINLQQEQLSKKNYILAGTITVTLLLALLAYSFYRRTRLRQRARLQAALLKQQEVATRAVIEAEEEERQRIARDLHDGVGQMMSAAKMNLSAFESSLTLQNADQRLSLEKIIGLVDESCKEIRSVSHNMMPNALLKNSLAIAIRDFIDKMDSKALKVHLFTEGLDDRLDSNIETVFYRVIQECVNNVIKHAQATTLDISVIRDKDGISATIEDNGRGFDTGDNEKFDGIGLKNILTRIEYLKGTVDFDSAIGRGTVVALNVPINR